MKKSIVLLSLLLALSLLAGCGGAAPVRDDIAAPELAASLLELLDARENMVLMRDAYLVGVMGLDLSDFRDFAVYVCAEGTNMDEFGVFRVSDPSRVKSAEEQLRGYLQLREDTWMNEYTPEEHPKLQSAKVEALGDYLLYTILSDGERAGLSQAFRAALTGK